MWEIIDSLKIFIAGYLKIIEKINTTWMSTFHAFQHSKMMIKQACQTQ